MQQIKKLAVDWVKCIVEIIMLSLIVCVITVIAVQKPNCYIWVALLPLFSLVGLLVHRLLHRVPVLDFFFDAVCPVALAYGLGQLLHSTTPEYVFMGILGAVLAIRARAIASRYWDEVSPSYLYTIFIAFNLIFALLTGVIPVLEPFRPAATVLGPIIVLTGLLAMNQLHLISLTDVQRNPTSAGKMVVSRSMNRQNKLLLVGIFAVILALSCLGIVMDGLKWLARKIYQIILWILEKMYGNQGGHSGGGGQEQNLAEVFGVEQVQRNPIIERIEQIFITVVVVLAITAAVVFLLFMLYKGLKKLFNFLKNLKFGGDVNEDLSDEYIDTRERLVDLKDLPKTYLNRVRDWIAEQLKREPNWNELKTVSEKVRALYRRGVYKALSHGFRYKQSYTASQTMEQVGQFIKTDKGDLDTLKSYYETVRYAGREPAADTVEELNKKI